MLGALLLLLLLLPLRLLPVLHEAGDVLDVEITGAVATRSRYADGVQLVFGCESEPLRR